MDEAAHELCVGLAQDPDRLERGHERAILAASVSEVIDEPS